MKNSTSKEAKRIDAINVIAGKHNRRILGVHIPGTHGSDLIAEAALAIQMKATMNNVINTIRAHSSVGEAVRETVMAANGSPSIFTKIERRVTWNT